MRRTIRLATTTLALGFLALPLASCDTGYRSHLGFDTFITHDKSTLREQNFSTQVETAKLDDASLRDVAEHYRNFGEGPVSVTVGYDPAARSGNTASHAKTEAERIAHDLRRDGISGVEAEILPAAGKGGKSMTTIAYTAVVAQMPKGCHEMNGLDGRQTDTDPDYPMGCEIEMQMARQIARPQDMEGRGGLDSAPGRRQNYIVDIYKQGKPNGPLSPTSSLGGQ